MSTHLVIGASGQIGGHLVNAVTAAGYEAVGTYYTHPVPGMRQVDIRNYADVVLLMAETRPTVVYLPAALSNVDYCELHPRETYEINVVGVHNVVRSAIDVEARLVYFSSGYVFDGRNGPYREDDMTDPICEYGRQKLIAEHHIMSCMQDYVIIRTIVVYGWERQGKNFVCRLLRTLEEGYALKVPMDQISSPTYAPDLARTVVQVATSAWLAQDTYHVVGPEWVDRYKFACEAAEVFGLDSNLIQPVATNELGQTAMRPLHTGMVIDKVSAELMPPLVGYRDGLRTMAHERNVGLATRSMLW